MQERGISIAALLPDLYGFYCLNEALFNPNLSPFVKQKMASYVRGKEFKGMFGLNEFNKLVKSNNLNKFNKFNKIKLISYKIRSSTNRLLLSIKLSF